MYKYIALSVRTCARIPHNPFASPLSPSLITFSQAYLFKSKCSTALRLLVVLVVSTSASKFDATSTTSNLISGGYSSKCKDAVCVCIRQVYQELAVWTVLWHGPLWV